MAQNTNTKKSSIAVILTSDYLDYKDLIAGNLLLRICWIFLIFRKVATQWSDFDHWFLIYYC